MKVGGKDVRAPPCQIAHEEKECHQAQQQNERRHVGRVGDEKEENLATKVAYTMMIDSERKLESEKNIFTSSKLIDNM